LLGAHADRDVIRKGQLLGKASFEDWDEFWSALRDFVRILNEKTTGKPFEIDAGGVFGDAEMLLKALGQSRHFETLLNGSDKAVADACLKIATAEGLITAGRGLTRERVKPVAARDDDRGRYGRVALAGKVCAGVT
jgi:hypothetical protein